MFPVILLLIMIGLGFYGDSIKRAIKHRRLKFMCSIALSLILPYIQFTVYDYITSRIYHPSYIALILISLFILVVGTFILIQLMLYKYPFRKNRPSQKERVEM